LQTGYQINKIQKKLWRLSNIESDIPEGSMITKRLINPIIASIKLLKTLISFWTDKENQQMLNKGYVLDNSTPEIKKAKKKRIESLMDVLQKNVSKQLKRFEAVEPEFKV
jgi:leucyl-tRNA synthetase